MTAPRRRPQPLLYGLLGLAVVGGGVVVAVAVTRTEPSERTDTVVRTHESETALTDEDLSVIPRPLASRPRVVNVVADVQPSRAELIATVPVHLRLGGFALSPSGTHFAVGSSIYDLAGHQWNLTGHHLAFLDDTEVLVASDSGGGTTLRRVALEDHPRPSAWSMTFEGERPLELAADPATGSWRLVTAEIRGSHIVRHMGRVGSSDVATSQWTPTGLRGRPYLLVGNGPAAVELVRDSDDVAEFVALNKERTPIAKAAAQWRCMRPGFHDERFACTVSESPNVPALWLIDPEGASLAMNSDLVSELTALASDGSSVFVVARDGHLHSVDMSGSGESGVRIKLPDLKEFVPTFLAVVPGTVAILWRSSSGDEPATVHVYRLR